jgi:hypothetical protein
MSLRRHDAATVLTQPRAGRPVDRVVDTAVKRPETAEQLSIGGVDDRIGGESGDIALPDRYRFRRSEPRLRNGLGHGGEIAGIDIAGRAPLMLQQRVEPGVHMRGQWSGGTDGQQGAEPSQRPRHVVQGGPRRQCPAPLGVGALAFEVLDCLLQQVWQFVLAGWRSRRELVIQCDDGSVTIGRSVPLDGVFVHAHSLRRE